GRDLVAQGLPAAGGHEHDRVSAAHDLVDDGRLLTPELLIAEDIVEDIEGGGRGCGGHTATLVHSPDTGRRGRDGPAAPAARLTRSAQRRGRPQLLGCGTAGGCPAARLLEAGSCSPGRWRLLKARGGRNRILCAEETVRMRPLLAGHCPNATTSRRAQP